MCISNLNLFPELQIYISNCQLDIFTCMLNRPMPHSNARRTSASCPDGSPETELNHHRQQQPNIKQPAKQSLGNDIFQTLDNRECKQGSPGKEDEQGVLRSDQLTMEREFLGWRVGKRKLNRAQVSHWVGRLRSEFREPVARICKADSREEEATQKEFEFLSQYWYGYSLKEIPWDWRMNIPKATGEQF